MPFVSCSHHQREREVGALLDVVPFHVMLRKATVSSEIVESRQSDRESAKAAIQCCERLAEGKVVSVILELFDPQRTEALRVGLCIFIILRAQRKE